MYQAIVIDDEKWVVRSLVNTIQNQKWFQVVAEFYDGKSGLAYLRVHRPELCFVDVRLPDISGLEILKAANEEELPTLFIVISGHAEFAYAQKAMLHNAISYCLKPFSSSELMDAMKKAWDILEDKKEEAIRISNLSQQAEIAAASDHENQPEPEHFVPMHLSSDHHSVQQMINYTEKHYTEDISIQNLASYCSINANYASQLFKQKMGFSFVSYLKKLRMEHASWLLTHTDKTVFLIADEVGYNNYFYFAKVFKKTTGKTPTEYRSSHRGEVTT